MDKEDVIHTHTHTHTRTKWNTAIKKNDILPFTTTWMDIEGIMLSEISQTEKDKYLCFHSYVKSKKKRTTK